MTTHGGKREGAGRPRTKNEDHHVRCSPKEWATIQKLLKEMRNPSSRCIPEELRHIPEELVLIQKLLNEVRDPSK